MAFRCLNCQQIIEGDPWWYDPSAHGMNKWSVEVTRLTGVVTQGPDQPTEISAPFHKGCLEKQMGRSIDS